jgi:orotidine-5'-phosphate decarboxylase
VSALPGLTTPPIAYALDFSSLAEARKAALAVREAIGMVKVGLELFIEGGPAAVSIGREVELPVFLDLKLHDIPETVDRAVARASALGARFLTVHAAGGPAMLRRAVDRAKKEGGGCTIAAVTILTSLDAADLAKMGVAPNVAGQARRLARLAFDEGVRVFVCSPREVAVMRAELGREALLVTAGVRPTSEPRAADDQKRVATARQAIVDGADWLVIGRPIRDAADPLAAARVIGREIEEARAAR